MSPEQNPEDSYIEPEKGRRTEMVFIDGILQRQVTDLVDMVDGTYYIDEAGDRISILMPAPGPENRVFGRLGLESHE